MPLLKNRKLFFGLIFILLSLIAVRMNQFFSPLHPQLISMNADRRNTALSRLSELSESKKTELVPKLISDLNSSNEQIRRFSLYALRKTGVVDNAILSAAAQSLSDADSQVREEAAVVLMESGEKAFPYIFNALQQGNETAVIAASEVMSRVGSNALPTAIQFIASSKNPEGQRRVLRLLRQWGDSADEAVPTLVRLLETGETPVKRDVALTLVAISTNNQAALPVLLASLRQSFDDEVVAALGSMGSGAKSAVSLLYDRLKEGKDSFLRETAPRPVIARALAKIDPRRTSLTDLQWDLKQASPIVRYRAAYEMSRRKGVDASAIPLLVRLLSDSDPFVAGRAAHALVGLNLEKTKLLAGTAYPNLIYLLGRVDDEKHIEGFRSFLAPELAKIGIPIMPDLIRSLKKGDVSYAAASAVIDNTDVSVLPFLKGCLTDHSEKVRMLAESGIKRHSSPSSSQ